MVITDFDKDEQVIAEVILEARKIQQYLWGEMTLTDKDYESNQGVWLSIFTKRIDKIAEIDFKKPGSKVELRKRILQQAALSVAALRTLDNEISVKQNG